MDRQTKNRDFSGPSCSTGVQKIKFGTERDFPWEKKNNRKLDPSSKLGYIGQIYTFLK